MRTILSALLAATLSGCTYQGGENWRRSVCDSIVDAAERAQCLDDATRSASEYRRSVDEALKP